MARALGEPGRGMDRDVHERERELAAQVIAALAELLESGKVTPTIDRAYRLPEVPRDLPPSPSGCSGDMTKRLVTHQGLRATPPHMAVGELLRSRIESGRHSCTCTTPGSIRSSPAKKRDTS